MEDCLYNVLDVHCYMEDNHAHLSLCSIYQFQRYRQSVKQFQCPKGLILGKVENYRFGLILLFRTYIELQDVNCLDMLKNI